VLAICNLVEAPSALVDRASSHPSPPLPNVKTLIHIVRRAPVQWTPRGRPGRPFVHISNNGHQPQLETSHNSVNDLGVPCRAPQRPAPASSQAQSSACVAPRWCVPSRSRAPRLAASAPACLPLHAQHAGPMIAPQSASRHRQWRDWFDALSTVRRRLLAPLDARAYLPWWWPR
jgi:hypothetical protein